jgi:hypothetical protein
MRDLKTLGGGRILGEARFVACEVDVRVTTVENLDFDLQIGWLPAGNSGGSERCGRGFGGVGFDGDGCGMDHAFMIGF